MNSHQVNPFGGLNFVIKELEKQGVGHVLAGHLPKLPPQAKYSWKDILYSFLVLLFMWWGLHRGYINKPKRRMGNNPFFKVPSPDRIFGRFKQLAITKSILSSPRGTAKHEFGINQQLNRLNVKTLHRVSGI